MLPQQSIPPIATNVATKRQARISVLIMDGTDAIGKNDWIHRDNVAWFQFFSYIRIQSYHDLSKVTSEGYIDLWRKRYENDDPSEEKEQRENGNQWISMRSTEL